jgi:hypothetical protein
MVDNMVKKKIILASILAIIVAMVGIASADETAVTFDDGSVNVGDELIDQYNGLSFSGDPAIVIQIAPGNLGFTAGNRFTSKVMINFAADDIHKVSIDVKGSYINVMQAFEFLNAQGKPLAVDVAVFNFEGFEKLTVISTDTPIKSVRMVSALNIGGLEFDNFVYSSSIPEFPAVALPVAAVIGIVFFFQQRKNKR